MLSQSAAVVLALFLGATSAAAVSPSDVSDLVGARGSGGEMELGRCGYEYVTMTRDTQYWRNAPQ